MKEEKSPPAAEPATPLPAYALELAAELVQPDITQKLLNAQLAEVLFIMRDAGYLYRNIVDPLQRNYFADHVQTMVACSEKLAERVARLNGAPEPIDQKRFHYVVEHKEGGGGPAKPENE